jgi:CubicO group peptidase (beta-lactamase class C family)
MQQMLIDITGSTFPEIMRELVLEPVGMTESTYEQPLPPDRYGQAATGYMTSGDPVPEDWHIYPEMAAAGLWTTPTDLARLAIEIQRIRRGEPGLILSQAMMEAMLTKGIGDWGLGFRIRGERRSLSFEHGGSNAGFQAAFGAFARTGQGVAIMTNSDTGGEILGTILRTLATIYEWPTEAYSARMVEAVDVEQSTIRRLAGTYTYFAGMNEIAFTGEADRLIVDYAGRWQAEAFPISETAWVVPIDGTRFEFEMESSGPAISVTVNGRIRAERKR